MTSSCLRRATEGKPREMRRFCPALGIEVVPAGRAGIPDADEPCTARSWRTRSLGAGTRAGDPACPRFRRFGRLRGRSAESSAVHSAALRGRPRSDARNNGEAGRGTCGSRRPPRTTRACWCSCGIPRTRNPSSPEGAGTADRRQACGSGGFGYDPHFEDLESGLTGAELSRSRARTRSRIAGNRRCARSSNVCARMNAAVPRSPKFAVLLPMSLSRTHIPWCIRKCPYCDFNCTRRARDVPEASTSTRCWWTRDRAAAGVGKVVSVVGGGTPASSPRSPSIACSRRSRAPAHPARCRGHASRRIPAP